MNKKTVALTTEQYRVIVCTMRKGFCGCRPNERIASALMLEANLGLRISDIVKLRLADIVRDGERYRLDITEQKTGKARTFTVPLALYQFVRCYCLDHGIGPEDIIFPVSERAIQKQLKLVCDYLGYPGISTHSFRHGDIPEQRVQHRPGAAAPPALQCRRHTAVHRHPAPGNRAGH